jgi:AraC family transcriptional regulator of adaptative response/methylated-DNA-[protein]-cysteine methyltransferase
MTETIIYGWGQSSLGTFLAAASATGLVAVEFADERAAARARLAEGFAGATLVEDQTAMGAVLERLAAVIDRPGQTSDLALDPRGSAAERQVWEALCRIPAGSTTTYGEIAAQLGAPFDAREVAAACAANRIAILIPCHRVVKKDGGLSGYRWGYRRKRALIDREVHAVPFALA